VFNRLLQYLRGEIGTTRGYPWVLRQEGEHLPDCRKCRLFESPGSFPCIIFDDDPEACCALDRTRKKSYFQPKEEDKKV